MKSSQKTIVYFIGIVLCFWVLSACKQKDPSPKQSINPIFMPYFNTFLDEGKKRGINFTDNELAITIQTSNIQRKYGNSYNNYAGYTDHKTHTIDIDSVWLQYADDISKEVLLFHELGHLMLKRDHNINQLPNGEYSSVMWTLQDNPANHCFAPLYTGKLRRTYYLDELFKSSIPVPAWATENIAWKEPVQTAQNVVVAANAWNKNNALEELVKANPDQISYKILPTGMMIIAKPTNIQEIKIPLATLFPNLAETPLQNYEVRMRYKLYGRGFELGWTPNSNPENKPFLTSNSCGETNYLGVGNNKGGFFFNYKIPQNLSSTNELILQNKDNYIMIWQNGQLLFQSDITAGTAASPLGMSLYFGASQYDFEFITVTKL